MMNAIAEFEEILDILKKGFWVPVYKDVAKDPMRMDRYHGITLMSIAGGMLEFLILERLSVLLLEAGVPHVNQTACRKGTLH